METYDTTETFIKTFPLTGDIRAQIIHILSGAIRAPSTHNSQPWLFHLEGTTVIVYKNKEIQLPYSDPVGRYSHISIGFLLHHIFVLGTSFGMHPHITLAADTDKIATITFDPASIPDGSGHPLLSSVFKRKNRRGIFDPTPIPAKVLAESIQSSSYPQSECEIQTITNRTAAAAIAELSYQNMLRVYHRPEFRLEMSRWITPPQSKRKDGLPTYSLNQPYGIGMVLPAIIRYFDIGKIPGTATREALASAPALFGFSSEETPRGWLSVGTAASHSALTLISHGYSYSVFVAVIEYEDTRTQAQDVFQLSGPLQFLFAAGTLPHSETWKTPRKDLASVLI